MKKVTYLLAISIFMIASLSFTSCDSVIANNLAGTWNGDMYITAMDQYGVKYDAVSSEICFNQDPYQYASGTGYWIDYYQNTSWGQDYVANHINWSVRNGVIYIDLIEEGTSLQISDYSLSNNYFSGVIYYNGAQANFRLKHTSSPNWGDFDYNGGAYAKPGGFGATTAPAKPLRILRPNR